MLTALLACLAGGLGAVARALVDEALTRRFPAWISTLLINLSGSLALGVASVIATDDALTVFGTGFCGGFTTFSTASWQVARELGRRRHRFAVAYLAATIGGCLAAAWLGVLVSS